LEEKVQLGKELIVAALTIAVDVLKAQTKKGGEEIQPGPGK